MAIFILFDFSVKFKKLMGDTSLALARAAEPELPKLNL